MKLKQLLVENIRKSMLRENVENIEDIKKITKHVADGGLIGVQPDMMLDPGGKISSNVWTKQKARNTQYDNTIKNWEGYSIEDFEGTPPNYKYAQLFDKENNHIGTVEFYTEDKESLDLQTVSGNEGSIKKITLK